MDIKNAILYEDNHIIVINKSSGTLAQGDSSDRTSLNEQIKTFIKQRDQKPGNVFLGIVHRLDLPVSGAIIYAKTSKGAARLSKQIREHSMSKYYICITQKSTSDTTKGEWRELSHNFIRIKNKTVATQKNSGDAKQGKLFFSTLFSTRERSCHLVKLHTGRKHQIRATFAHRKTPIIGDTLYNGESYCEETISLHAFLVQCLHTTSKEPLTFNAEPPTTFFTSDEEKELFTQCSSTILPLTAKSPEK